MTDEDSTVACWIRCIYMHQSRNFKKNLLRIKLRWHDKQVQHGGVSGQTCLYAPWRLGGLTDEVSTVAC